MSGATEFPRQAKGPRLPRLRRLIFAARCAVLIGWGAPLAAAADPEAVIIPNRVAPHAAPSTSLAGGLYSFSLLAGAALAGVAGWALWRGRRRGRAGAVRASLAIDETRALGNRQYLVVASYEGRKFLLGVCPGRIDLLAPLAPETPPRMAE